MRFLKTNQNWSPDLISVLGHLQQFTLIFFQMMRTTLHYAYCLYGEGQIVTCLVQHGASESTLDVVKSFFLFHNANK